MVVILTLLSTLFLFQTAAGAGILLTAAPQELIPGLTPTLTIRCTAGSSAGAFRDLFFLQLKRERGGQLSPLATINSGGAPTLHSTDPSFSLTGNLNETSPGTAFLQVTVNGPTETEAGIYVCEMEGLDRGGQTISYSEMVNVTVNAQASQVDEFLKYAVAELQGQARQLELEIQILLGTTQQLENNITSKHTELERRQSDLHLLSLQVQNLEQAVNAKKAALNVAAEEIIGLVGDISAEAPSERIAFNAIARTERNYPSGAMVQFETVELNDGDGYSPSTSHFMPPVRGVYFFTSAQLVHDTASASTRGYAIRKNSTILSGAFNADDRQGSMYQHSSASTVAQLVPSDSIALFQQYSSSLTSDLVPYQTTPGGVSTNLAGYLVY